MILFRVRYAYGEKASKDRKKADTAGWSADYRRVSHDGYEFAPVRIVQAKKPVGNCPDAV